MAAANKILFVNSEIYPYLPETPISKIGRQLPQGIQERKREIRSFMPKFGNINERKNQLHEVIRLSGMNIIVKEVDRPLTIKVASISSARMQVYFIDNEDYFHRKFTYLDADGKFFADNGERAAFFARGVLETVKKLRWAPDIVHCHGWISYLLPAYLRKAYKDDPIFAESKVVVSLYDDVQTAPVLDGFKESIMIAGMDESDFEMLGDDAGTGLAKLAVRYSDGVIFGVADVHDEVREACGGIPVLAYDPASIENGSYIDAYNNFYDLI
ncbi:MAG: glycogen/starch synthase [Bacteroidales bacterium]|nr:glycogen/starch synthase [Bacteroidales bacterium]